MFTAIKQKVQELKQRGIISKCFFLLTIPKFSIKCFEGSKNRLILTVWVFGMSLLDMTLEII